MKRFLIIGFLFILAGCTERFEPDLDNTNENLLVVEGFITDQRETYSVKITRSRNVNASNVFEPVEGALVTIEDESGQAVHLPEQIAGVYSSFDDDLVGEIGKSYRLNIEIGGQHYQSSYEEILPSFPIDSIYSEFLFVQEQDELGNITVSPIIDVLANINFPNSDYYYRYDWEGTYSALTPSQGGLECWEEPENFPFVTPIPGLICYVEDLPMGEVNTFSSNGLTGNTFQGHRITSLNPVRRFQRRYNIQLTQYSMSESSYVFWRDIENQNRLTGGLFDRPPSQILSNITSLTNPAEIVLGFFSAYGISKKRVFLQPVINIDIDHYESDCQIPTDGLGQVVGLKQPYCCDCRLLPNSSSTKPEFWE